jgi:quinol-cytochrome oxidoreductase complex cytochrome b subunit
MSIQPEGQWPRWKQWLHDRLPWESVVRALSSAVLYGALDERLNFDEALQQQLNKPVPRHALRHLWCMGGISLLLFGNQVVTGILLLMYYKPGPEVAYDSVKHIMNDVAMGWLLRQMHAWGAHLMIIAVLIHMLKIYYNRAYRPPRELNWMVGTVLLFLTLTFAFTGYLLPWDQLSYWATTVGAQGVENVPFIGGKLMILMRGGQSVSDVTLSRFFALHVSVLPWVTVAFMLMHFIMIRRQGISDPL